MTNKIELKIKKDSDNVNVHLNEMSINAAKSFLVLLESLTKIIELTPNNSDAKIQIIEGSACVVASGEDTVISIKNELLSIINHESQNTEIVKEWRSIQNLIKANGLEYEINYYDGASNSNTSLISDFKNNRAFYAKSNRKTYSYQIKFITGNLIEAGGKKPNIHIDELSPIECSRDNAIAAKDFLYNNIRVSVWQRIYENGEEKLELCDVYNDNNLFLEFKELVDQINNSNTIEKLTHIHSKIKNLLIEGRFSDLRRFLLLWCHNSTDAQTLKIILVITKQFKNHELLAPYIQRIKELYTTASKKYLNP